MTATLSVYLIVCPLVFLGGLVDAIAGGGGFISLPAYMISGVPIHMSIGTNKLSSGMGTTLATYRFAKQGYINGKLAIFCIIGALSGSMIGAKTALLIQADIFKKIMIVILPITALYVLFNKGLKDTIEEDNHYSQRKMILLSIIIAFFLGIYDGFYGPGTGTFLMLLLTSVAHMTLNQAAGITKVINLSTNIAALVVYIINGKVLFTIGVVAGIFGIAGNYIGTKLFTEKGAKIVKPLILFVLGLFFIKIISELI